MQVKKYFLWLVLLCVTSLSAESATKIGKIYYEGNEVTQASVLDRELYIKEGDVLDAKLVEKSKQAIMDLGLFKTVKYYMREHYANDEVDAQLIKVDVYFVVQEKYYLLVFPKAKVDDADDVSLGLQLRWDNVWGLNHELRLLAENRGKTQGIEEKRNAFSYYYPNLANSAYSVKLKYKDLNVIDDNPELINRHDEIYQISVSRWLNELGHSRGWFANGQIVYQKRFNEFVLDQTASNSFNALILGMDAGYKDVSEYEYNRGGKAYGYRLDWSHESIGSENEFTRHLLYYRSYYPIKDRPNSNINVQTQFGHSNSDVLGATAFSLGSNTDLRGYESNRFTDNTMLLVNLEYMFPQAQYPVIRYVYFIDLGNTYSKINDVLHNPLNLGTGFGLRWKLKAFVRLNFRIDFGYGYTDRDYVFSLGTKHAF